MSEGTPGVSLCSSFTLLIFLKAPLLGPSPLPFCTDLCRESYCLCPEEEQSWPQWLHPSECSSVDGFAPPAMFNSPIATLSSPPAAKEGVSWVCGMAHFLCARLLQAQPGTLQCHCCMCLKAQTIPLWKLLGDSKLLFSSFGMKSSISVYYY